MKKNFFYLMVIFITVIGCAFFFNFGCGQTQNGSGTNVWIWEEHPELGSGTVEFTEIPIDTQYWDEFTPLGHIMPPQHPIPTSAGGFQFNQLLMTSEPQDVRSPAKGVITKIRLSNNTSAGFSSEDYAFTIYHTNDFVTFFDHLSNVDPKILSKLSSPLVVGENSVYVTIEAGDVIAKTGIDIAGLGWYLYDRTLPSKYIDKSLYGPYSIYSVFPLDYFRSDLKDYLYKFVKRTKDPRGGRFDFDVDGTIQGNWIVEGSDPVNKDFWNPWLSFCFDMYDPDYRRISIGNTLIQTIGETYGKLTCPISGPDFTSVTPTSGIATYKLRMAEDGQEFFGRTIDPTIFYTLIVKMIDTRKIKVELFKGDVSDPSFTSKALIFTR